MEMEIEHLQMDTEMIGEPWEKVIEDTSCGEIRDIASIAVKDFTLRLKLPTPEVMKVVDAEYTADFSCFILYNFNIFVRCLDPQQEDPQQDPPKKYEGVIQSMVWRGLVYERTEIFQIPSILPFGDTRESCKNLKRLRPDLKDFARDKLLDKLEDMGLSIDHPTNTSMPVLAWECHPLDSRYIEGGIEETIGHSIIVRVKPPRGKKSKPGLHGLWRLDIFERKWIQTFSPELTDRLKKGIREGQEKTYPPRIVTHDEKTGRAVCNIKALVHLDPVCLETPRIVTLALFALDNHNRKKGLNLKFERVVDVRLRTGFMYLLTLKASDEENITHIFMTMVTIFPASGLMMESTALVEQENDLPKDIQQLFELGGSTSCCSEEEVAE